MRVVLESIVDVAPPGERTATAGQYRVTLATDGVEHVLIYTVLLKSTGHKMLEWTPRESILSDPRIPVLVVASLNDTVVEFHLGKSVDLPKQVLPLDVDSETAVTVL